MRQVNGSDADKPLDPAGATPRRWPLLLLVGWSLALVAQAVGAGDGSNVNQVGAPPVVKPRVSGNLLGPVRQQLSLGFFLAQSRIRTHPTCSALFERFRVDGAELLGRVRFNGAAFETSFSTCKHGVAAYTTVGSHQIVLCPGFGGIPVPGAALILIHEVLHSAGMTEKPSDPNGFAAGEINVMVKVSCNL
jgi:hypothetical protein